MIDVKRQPWKPEEDSFLRDLVTETANPNWKDISRRVSEKFTQRSSKQCRDRYNNYLDPKIDTSSNVWSPEDDYVLAKMVLTYGNKWTAIAKLMPGKSENMVKNRWNSSLSKRAHYVGNMIIIDEHKGPGRTPKYPQREEPRQCYSVPLFPQSISQFSSGNNTIITHQPIDTSWRNVKGVQSFMPPNFPRFHQPDQATSQSPEIPNPTQPNPEQSAKPEQSDPNAPKYSVQSFLNSAKETN